MTGREARRQWLLRGGLIGLTIVIAFGVHWRLSQRWSPNPDEMPNLCAGLAYLSAQQYYHYSVNPPLVKNLAALPAWLDGIRGPVLGEQPGRPEFASGWRFAERNPEDGWRGLVAGRRVLFVFTLIGALATYRLVANTIDANSAALAACIWVTLPPVVGQGPMIQCDIAAAATGMLAISSFQQWTAKRSWWLAIESALLLGIALTTKYSWVLLIYILISWSLIDRLRRGWTWGMGLRDGVQLGVMHVIALLVIGGAFQFQEWGTSLQDGQWRSTTFRRLAGDLPMESTLGAVAKPLAALPIPLPRPLLVGFDIQLGDLERVRPAFYLGQWHERSSPVYYPVTLAAKLPIAAWLFVLVGTVVCFRRSAAMPLLYPPAIMLVALMTSTKMNWHVRYAYILLPFVAALAGVGVMACWRWARTIPTRKRVTPLVGEAGLRWLGLFGKAATGFGCLAVLLAAPSKPSNSFSYTNRLFGNTEQAGRWVGGSAVDWDHAWIYARHWSETQQLLPGQLLSIEHRWTPLSFSGWEMRPLVHHRGDTVATPLYILVPAYQRQRLEQSENRNCFEQAKQVGTIVGGIEIYQVESLAALAGWPNLYSMHPKP